MEIHMHTLMLMLLQLTQNHVKTDAHSFPYTLQMVTES